MGNDASWVDSDRSPWNKHNRNAAVVSTTLSALAMLPECVVNTLATFARKKSTQSKQMQSQLMSYSGLSQGQGPAVCSIVPKHCSHARCSKGSCKVGRCQE